MWEVSTWLWKSHEYDTELAAYRLLWRLQGTAILHLHGVVRLPIAYTPLYAITDTIRGLASECILGSNMEQVKSGIDVSHEDAKTISNRCWTRSVVPRQRTTYCITTFTSATSFYGAWIDLLL
ncbi:uncharacterized protein BT62DRAFT_485090 [Guyanagaster necrorhizus]|uniref:Uncharacterized protein n=1 Tax=Guyanagaster necrorhizus TaxID=856835 RepID=A0A9P8AN41_9AGAR|nr:uncharacterized protein BT62DRAFT_485090 [Guyanagaster necrorhizus MCA 3950]KAG7441366.1 hypothetical protein BT62DRAFT_485090 [Guyanagaster necrorhizus MCA 3950]